MADEIDKAAEPSGSICGRVWSALTAAEPTSFGSAEFPQQFSEDLIEEWLGAEPPDKQFVLSRLSEVEKADLGNEGFDIDALQMFLDEPIPRKGPAARRAIEFPQATETLKWDRETAFLYDILKTRKFTVDCPFGGAQREACAGIWFSHQLLAYLFKGQIPFFLILSTIRTRRSILYFPTLRIQIIIYDRDWRKPNDIVSDIKRFFLKNFTSISALTGNSCQLMAFHVGFCHNIAHNLRDDLGGLRAAIDAGLLENIDKVVVGPNMYYGRIEELFPEIPGEKIDYVGGIKQNESISIRYVEKNYFPIRIFGTFLTTDFVKRVTQVSVAGCDPKVNLQIRGARQNHYPLIAVTIRSRSRSWAQQQHGIAELVGSLVNDFPTLAVVLDGVNSLSSKSLIEEESAIAEKIVAELRSLGVTVFNTIGTPMTQSVSWAAACDAYVASYGAGLAKFSWLAGIPGVVHSNETVISNYRGRWFNGADLENQNRPIYVDRAAVQDIQDDSDGLATGPNDLRSDLQHYECDWKVLDRLLRLILRRASRLPGNLPLEMLRPPPGSRQMTHGLEAGRNPTVSLRKESRCLYGYYIPKKALKLGIHHGTDVIVFLPGLLQTGPPKLLMDLADKLGTIILNPHFPADLVGYYDRYAYCFMDSNVQRFDLLLLDMLDEFSSKHAIDLDKFYICGASGGAQFVNRFLALHPEKLKGVSMLGPGAITRLSSNKPWWVGTGDCHKVFGLEPNYECLKTMPLHVVVGEEDLSPTDGLCSKHWMDEASDMGENRLERAEILVADLESLGATVCFERIPGLAHDLASVWGYSVAFLEQIIPEKGSK